MKIEEVELSQIKKKLVIDAEGEEVAGEHRHVVDDVHKGVSIPGFRKGKVPRELVQKMFREYIDRETSDRLVKSTLDAAFKERRLRPVGNPEVTNVKAEFPGSFHFEVEFEVMPDLLVENYRKIPLKRVLLPVTDEDVEAQIQELRKSAAEFRSVEEAAESYHSVLVDLEATVEGTGAKVVDQKAILLSLGTDSEVPAVAAKLIGAKAGEAREFSIAHTEETGPAALAGKTVLYKARVSEVKERILPNLDDDFATTLGEYTTLEDLRREVREKLEQARDKAVRNKYSQQVTEYLSSAYPVEIPTALYQDYALRNTISYKQYIEKTGRKVENLEEEMEKAFTHYAGEAVAFTRISLVLERIAELESITMDDEQLGIRIQEIAQEARKSTEAVRAKMGVAGIEQLRSNLLKEKVIDFLIAEATID